jgi:alanyl-tRNA synthetase
MTLPDAKDWGAIALFGETYDEMVRVVQVGGPWSRELCGGTHVSRTSQIGPVAVTGESSVGSGVRRIEAEVGIDALRSLLEERAVLRRITAEMKVPLQEVEAKFTESLEQLRRTQKQLDDLRLKKALQEMNALLVEAESMGSHSVLCKDLGDLDSTETLRQLTLSAKNSLGSSSVVLFGAIVDQRPFVMIAVGGDAQASVNAGHLAKTAASILGGGGGGKSDFAQAGGSDVLKISSALKAAKDQIS